jgi:hypothetical protein
LLSRIANASNGLVANEYGRGRQEGHTHRDNQLTTMERVYVFKRRLLVTIFVTIHAGGTRFFLGANSGVNGFPLKAFAGMKRQTMIPFWKITGLLSI